MQEQELLKKISEGDFSVVDVLTEKIKPEVKRRLGKMDIASEICIRTTVIEYLDKVKQKKAPEFQNLRELLLHLIHKSLKLYYKKAEGIILDKKLMDALLNNDGWAYYYMQMKFFPAITAMILVHGGTEEDAKDIIMDGIYALIKNIREGKYELRSSTRLKSYFIKVCKNIWLDKLKKEVKHIKISIDSTLDTLENIPMDEIDEEILTSRQKIVKELLEYSSPKCRQLLIHYYYYGMSHKEIAKKLGYSNEHSSKTQKMKCLKKIKEIIRNKRKDFFEK